MQLLQKIHSLNFSAGPSCLPRVVKDKLNHELNKDISIFEISHRHFKVLSLWDEVKFRLKSLLKIPDRFEILYLPGGTRAQIAPSLQNLKQGPDGGGFLMTGYWARWAYKEAAQLNFNPTSLGLFQESLEEKKYSYIFYCDNETLSGSFFRIKHRGVQNTIILDATSSFLCEEIDFNNHDIIIAGAQKNLGLAGGSIIIFDPELIQKNPIISSPFNYSKQLAMQSQATTPSILNVFVMNEVLKWLEAQEDRLFLKKRRILAMELYNLIDKSNIYYSTIMSNFRSSVTITFNIAEDKYKILFDIELEKRGFFFLKAHQNFSDGYRISLYNAIVENSLEDLIVFLNEFEQSIIR